MFALVCNKNVILEPTPLWSAEKMNANISFMHSFQVNTMACPIRQWTTGNIMQEKHNTEVQYLECRSFGTRESLMIWIMFGQCIYVINYFKRY